MTRQRDALNIERRNLPMFEIDKDYVFDGPEGKVRLLDMFDGRAQLIIYHFMFDPEWEDGCPSCTAGTQELSDGFFDHLHTRDTSYAMVSRAPLAKLERWKEKQGWDIPWYSSFGSDFNYDFGVTIDPAVAPPEYNFRTKAEAEARDKRSVTSRSRHPAAAASSRSTAACSTRTRSTRVGSSRRAVRTTSSTSPRWGGRRSGRSRRAAASPCVPPPPTSRRKPITGPSPGHHRVAWSFTQQNPSSGSSLASSPVSPTPSIAASSRQRFIPQIRSVCCWASVWNGQLRSTTVSLPAARGSKPRSASASRTTRRRAAGRADAGNRARSSSASRRPSARAVASRALVMSMPSTRDVSAASASNRPASSYARGGSETSMSRRARGTASRGAPRRGRADPTDADSRRPAVRRRRGGRGGVPRCRARGRGHPPRYRARPSPRCPPRTRTARDASARRVTQLRRPHPPAPALRASGLRASRLRSGCTLTQRSP